MSLKGFEIGFFSVKEGVTEETMLKAMHEMEINFLNKEKELLHHYIVKLSDNLYADIAIATSKNNAIEICNKWHKNSSAQKFLELIDLQKKGDLDNLSFGDILQPG
jgi:hypothetical protein